MIIHEKRGSPEKTKGEQEGAKKFGVKRIGIFGSIVRNEAKEDSDVDIFVEFEPGKATFKNVAGLVDFLESLFGREVDLLTPAGIESIRLKHVKEEIRKEIQYA